MNLHSRYLVSSFYHEAKNRIIRPDCGIFISDYFVRHWIPRLGNTAACIVLFLRSRAGAIREGEAAVQVSQEEIAAGVNCSVRTLRTELHSNFALQQFVRIESRFLRDSRGHLRRTENLYYVAMDDPLVPEDEPLLQEMMAQGEQARPTSRIIVREDQNPSPARRTADDTAPNRTGKICRIGKHTEPAKFADYNRSANFAEQSLIQKPTYRNVSETRPYGSAAETSKVSHTPLEEWRRMTEDLAHHSAKELDDMNSLGFHIQVWNHARKHDKLRGTMTLTDGVFNILRELSQRRAATNPPQPQGRAWTRRTLKWFEENGVPLQVKTSGELYDPQEAAEIRAALTEAPFFQSLEEEKQKALARQMLEHQIETYWNSLSSEEQQAIDAQSEEALRQNNPFLAGRLEKNRNSAPARAALMANRRALLAARLGLSLPEE